MQTQDTKIEQVNTAARQFTREQSTETLIEAFEVTEGVEVTAEVATTRGWIMDELEARNPAAFEEWLDTEDCDVADLRRLFGIEGGRS